MVTKYGGWKSYHFLQKNVIKRKLTKKGKKLNLMGDSNPLKILMLRNKYLNSQRKITKTHRYSPNNAMEAKKVHKNHCKVGMANI